MNEKILLYKSPKVIKFRLNMSIFFFVLGLILYLFGLYYPENQWLQKFDYGVVYFGVGAFFLLNYLFDKYKPYFILSDQHVKKNSVFFPKKVAIHQIRRIQNFEHGLIIHGKQTILTIFKNKFDDKNYDILSRFLKDKMDKGSAL